MGLDDLTMMANTPPNVTPTRTDRTSGAPPADVEKAREADLSRRSGEAAQAEIDKAAAGETMPPPKDECEDCEETRAERIARRGQDPPKPASP